MTVQDAYDERYAALLWSLLPEHHRASDSADLDRRGPLQELLARIGAQVAETRRGIDRLWDDAYIETASDWVVPYLADLVATRLVPSLDARGQRLDVLHTIRNRRSKGTVWLLERLANDVTGYPVRVVEFFDALGRTRHGLDPAIGMPAESPDPAGALRLQRQRRLTGALTGSSAGGWADLRDPLGAMLVDGPFDEFHHTADVRRGRGDTGWYGIAKVGVFLWRTKTLRVDRATPVPVSGCPGQYTFDPTGRQIPLFLRPTRTVQGERAEMAWQPAPSWQLPSPLSQLLWDAIVEAALPGSGGGPGPTAYPDPEAARIWPESLSVGATGSGGVLELDELVVWPEVGRFRVLPGGPDDVEAAYHHGLFGRIGAGPYDRRRPGALPTPDPLPVERIDGGSPIALPNAIAAVGGAGTVLVEDGRTLTATGDAAAVTDLAIRADDGERAVVRTAPGSMWTFTGAGGGGATAGSRLRLEGLLVSGTDLRVRGRFERVEVTCCTLDPGGSGAARTPPSVWDVAVDGRDLTSTTLWIEGTVRTLVVDRSITGPIRVAAGGLVEELEIVDSVVQGLPTALDEPGLALETSAGLTTLTRTTLLGPASLHRLEASESILHDLVRVRNAQDGCVRFSAWATGSALPRRYESVELPPAAPIFVSRRYGEWGYAQLSDGADSAIRSGNTRGTPSVLTGSRDGSEQGAFCRDIAAIKDASLLIKAQEYLPVGLAPVLVHLPEADPQGETTRGRPWPPM